MSSTHPKDEGFNLELRVYLIQYLVLAIFVALGMRFYVLQVARHDDYQARAENNRIRDIPIPAPRGATIGRNGSTNMESSPRISSVTSARSTLSSSRIRSSRKRDTNRAISSDRAGSKPSMIVCCAARTVCGA